MFDEQTKRNLLNVLGDEYMRRGKLNEAVKAFILVGNQPKLVAIGEDYEKVGLFSNAVDCYKMAGSQDKLMKVGKKCLDEGKIGDVQSFQSRTG